MTQSKLTQYSDTDLLAMKVKDLPLDEFRLPFNKQVLTLKAELRRRGINWTPHLWASEEWFSPDGVPGFAFPFTLLDPRLIKLEKKHVGFLEGSSEKELVKLLRHECAHALDNAFHLRKNKKRQALFGLSSRPYPTFYVPDLNSKDYVKHLPQGYAQAHPEEDWAETFAVWLTPKYQWKEKYKTWPAMEKLLLVDEIIKKSCLGESKVSNSDTPLHFRDDNRTLKQYFNWRKQSLGLRRNNFYADKVNEVFSTDGKEEANEVFKKYESVICKRLAKRSGISTNIVKLMIKELKQECKIKNYRLKYSSYKTKTIVEEMLSFHSAEFLRKKRHRVFM